MSFMSLFFGSTEKKEVSPPPYPASQQDEPPCCAPPAPLQQSQGVQQQNFNRQASSPMAVKKVVHPKSNKPSDELVGLIVTLSGDNGSSYDNMFGMVPQEGPEGTRTDVYRTSINNLVRIAAALQQRLDAGTIANNADADTNKENNIRDDLEELVRGVQELDADSVVFNFECCGMCSERGFGIDADKVLNFVQYLIGRGHMVMCSDFSLKALIGRWNTETAPALGPNPFVQTGVCSGSISMAFDTEKLAECPSTQLQKVGDLCKEGNATCHAMSSTITYSMNKQKADTPCYKAEVLTVVTSSRAPSDELKWTLNGKSGVCGHVLLTYPSGGKLLTSAGHWVELVKLDVSEESLMRVAEMEYGQAYATEMQQELAACTNDTTRKAKMQERCARMVQSSAPSEYCKGWGRSKAGYKGNWKKGGY